MWTAVAMLARSRREEPGLRPPSAALAAAMMRIELLAMQAQVQVQAAMGQCSTMRSRASSRMHRLSCSALVLRCSCRNRTAEAEAMKSGFKGADA